MVRSAQRKRTIALQLTPDGQVTLRAPLGTKRPKLEEVLRAKAAWLEHRLSGAWGEIPPPNPPREFVAGETFHVLGKQRRLKLSAGAKEAGVRLEGDYLHVVGVGKKSLGRETVRTQLKTWFAAQAGEFFPERVARWTAKLAVKAEPRVIIADQTKRWASCGKGAVLRFNWRLLGAPVSLVDYVIVHELCHLNHPDHSPEFWKQLARVMPDYAERERHLSRIGAGLNY